MTQKLTLLATVAFAIAFSAQAHAGFEWKGPLSPPAAQTPAAPAVAAPQDGGLQELAPVIMWTGDDAAMPAEKVEEVEAAPVESAVPAQNLSSVPAQSVAASAQVLPPSASDDDGGQEVSGFGADLPLVIALQQVVPAGFQFSFSSGINPGALVSWEGGKPWKKVLSDMLASQGLGYKLQGNVVVIGYFKNQEAVAPVASTLPLAAPANVSLAAPANVSLAAPAERSLDLTPLEAEAVAKDLPPPGSSEPVMIRRQKPSSLLKQEVIQEQAPVVQQADVQPLPPAPQSLTAPPVEVSVVRPASVVADIAPAAPSQPAAPDWMGAKGQTLRDVLGNWSEVAGVELYWSIDYDYRLADDIAYPGTYDEAVGKLLDGFATVRPQPYGQLHQNGDSPRVLVVKSYDLTK